MENLINEVLKRNIHFVLEPVLFSIYFRSIITEKMNFAKLISQEDLPNDKLDYKKHDHAVNGSEFISKMLTFA